MNYINVFYSEAGLYWVSAIRSPFAIICRGSVAVQNYNNQCYYTNPQRNPHLIYVQNLISVKVICMLYVCYMYSESYMSRGFSLLSILLLRAITLCSCDVTVPITSIMELG